VFLEHNTQAAVWRRFVYLSLEHDSAALGEYF